MTYFLLKFLHVLSTMIWLGGLLTMSVLSMRLARTGDRGLLAAMRIQSEFLESRVIGPTAGLTLLTGFAVLGVGRLGFPFWVLWGLGIMVLSMVLGTVITRRASVDLRERLANPASSDSEIATAQRRLGSLGLINVLLLVSALWVMVFKPTL